MCDEHAQHRPHTENVVLEIGEELGALVVYTDAALLHQEIEVSRVGADARRSHKDVLERHVNGRSVYAAVFDRMERGTYTLWHRDEVRTRDVAIAGGVIAELDWRTSD